MTIYNYSKLLGRIKEKGLTQEGLCAKINMDSSVFSLRVNNKRRFRQDEMERICKALDIEAKDMCDYFFAH